MELFSAVRDIENKAWCFGKARRCTSWTLHPASDLQHSHYDADRRARQGSLLCEKRGPTSRIIGVSPIRFSTESTDVRGETSTQREPYNLGPCIDVCRKKPSAEEESCLLSARGGHPRRSALLPGAASSMRKGSWQPLLIVCRSSRSLPGLVRRRCDGDGLPAREQPKSREV